MAPHTQNCFRTPTGGKYGVFLLLAILLNVRITKESQKKYEQYANKGRI